jgi:uncharacterized membrane protein YebE (DUF533 family)
MSIQAHLSTLVQLAAIDGHMDKSEKEHIYMLGKANNVSKEEIDELTKEPIDILPEVGTMTEDEKFNLLYDIVQLMKIDSQVYLSEIKFCEDLAEKLGFKKKVISALSSRIYSDPAITANIESLKKAVAKYRS